MSLSLTLIFERPGRAPETVYAANKLEFGYVDDELRMALQPVSVPLPEGIEYHDDAEGLQRQYTDAYGAPLTYAPAALLMPRILEVARSNWEKAVVAFVAQLPPSTRVVLRWH
jgi:hypothetical protein